MSDPKEVPMVMTTIPDSGEYQRGLEDAAKLVDERARLLRSLHEFPHKHAIAAGEEVLAKEIRALIPVSTQPEPERVEGWISGNNMRMRGYWDGKRGSNGEKIYHDFAGGQWSQWDVDFKPDPAPASLTVPAKPLHFRHPADGEEVERVKCEVLDCNESQSCFHYCHEHHITICNPFVDFQPDPPATVPAWVSVPCWKCARVNDVRPDLVQFRCGSCGADNYAKEGFWPTAQGDTVPAGKNCHVTGCTLADDHTGLCRPYTVPASSPEGLAIQVAEFLESVDIACCDAGCDKAQAFQFARALRALSTTTAAKPDAAELLHIAVCLAVQMLIRGDNADASAVLRQALVDYADLPAPSISEQTQRAAILVDAALERIIDVANAGAKQSKEADSIERFDWVLNRATAARALFTDKGENEQS